jgi:glycosyltransferase involved in cell wall biosynthesis
MAVYLRAQFSGAKIVHHFHNPIVAREPFLSRFRGAVDEVTAVSAYVAAEVRKTYGNKEVNTVYNGVDLERFKPSVRRREGVAVVNFLGRTGIEKAPDLLLRAALRLAIEGLPVRVQLIGSNHWGRWEPDPYQTELKSLCEALQRAGGEVCVTGHLSREQVPVQLMNADVHVLPSRWEEPCALSLLEGLSAGLAVVASRTGGTPEIIGNAGLLFERDSVQELTLNLRKLLTDGNLRCTLGIEARRRAQMFTWDRCWEGFKKVLF